MAYRRTPAIQARLDAQRVALLDAAITLLAEQGYAGLSVSAVARRAGVAAGTVYLHFDSKAALSAEVFRTVVTREVVAVRGAVASETDPMQMARAVIETFAGRAMRSPRLAFALLAEPVDPVVEQLRLEYRTAFRDLMVAAIDAGIAAGSVPAQNSGVVASALVGAIGEALVRPLATGSHDPDTVSTLVQFAHRALGAVDVAYA